MSIPKIIHQVWINDTWKDSSLKKDVPEKWKKSQQEWQRLHPDWKYILWTDDLVLSFIEKNYPEYLEFYKNYEYLIQRADMIRYFILYDFGGVYSDLDQYPTENIEKYITTNLNYFVYSPNSDILTNQFMISPKGSNIMKIIQQQLLKDIPFYAIGKHLKIYYSTGPFMLNNTLLNLKKESSCHPRARTIYTISHIYPTTNFNYVIGFVLNYFLNSYINPNTYRFSVTKPGL